MRSYNAENHHHLFHHFEMLCSALQLQQVDWELEILQYPKHFSTPASLPMFQPVQITIYISMYMMIRGQDSM